MAMEFWEKAQREKGNIAGAEMARVLREQYGDVGFDGQEVPVVLTPAQRREELFKIGRRVADGLKDLGLPPKLCNRISYGIRFQDIPVRSIGDLARVRDQELDAIDRFGPKSVQMLRALIPYQKPEDKPLP